MVKGLEARRIGRDLEEMQDLNEVVCNVEVDLERVVQSQQLQKRKLSQLAGDKRAAERAGKSKIKKLEKGRSALAKEVETLLSSVKGVENEKADMAKGLTAQHSLVGRLKVWRDQLTASLLSAWSTVQSLSRETESLVGLLTQSQSMVERSQVRNMVLEGDSAAQLSAVKRLLSLKRGLRTDLNDSRLTVGHLQAENADVVDQSRESQSIVQRLQEDVRLAEEREVRLVERMGKVKGVLQSDNAKAQSKIVTLETGERGLNRALSVSRATNEMLAASEARLKVTTSAAWQEVLKLRGRNAEMGGALGQVHRILQAETLPVDGTPHMNMLESDLAAMKGVVWRSQAQDWLAAIPGLRETAQAERREVQELAFHVFVQGDQLDVEVSLNDIYDIVEGMDESLKMVVALVLGFVRKQVASARTAEVEFNVARSLVLLRCLELVYLHVHDHAAMLMVVREVFDKLGEKIAGVMQHSCLVAGLAKWLTIVLSGRKSLGLVHCIVSQAKYDNTLLVVEAVHMMPHEKCLIMVKSFESNDQSLTVVWLSSFSLQVERRGLGFLVGEEIFVLGKELENQRAVMRLFSDAISRM